ncbi:type IX secretion system periplasmic lipoprotein PorW/SprE [Foetidibacter luteolus]|uniref:type IX secretion system periplasmic lipoprotein PorW/SprE n=1 Tax=Foetidibacter luteolus TaxID=2608880 RepID=UPI00129BBB78|nr:hypothetical protein [Foetidibacter luteolus]
MNNATIKIFCCLLSVLLVQYCLAQPGSSIDLDKDKPKKYENRRLASEKTGEKKFGFGRRLYQNTVTHFNYYFNANNKLNEIVENAKLSFKEDYTQPLIPFYNYSLETIAQNRSELDSVIYHATAGVLLHDLRNNWIDNLYMLLGKAYFYRGDYDSAIATFRYVNYAFAPKDDGYDIPIGSNESGNEGKFSVSTKEKKGFGVHKPSRNEAFLWMSRAFIDSGEVSEAGGMIEILKGDPNFPERLRTDLHELDAYLFYKEKAYDSAAIHLEQALDNANGKRERSRWEFLIAQLYEHVNKIEEASAWYGKAADHAVDPILEVYANLNSVMLNSGTGEQNFIQEKINNLLKLARREKYARYRDIIYYAAAQAELERGGYSEAMKDLEKSVKSSIDNPQQKSLSFTLAADISYETQKYELAASLYDSVDVNSLTLDEDKKRVDERKSALQLIVENKRVIFQQDSLQKVAAMPIAERDALIKKTVKQLHKAQGIKEEEGSKQENINPAVQREGSADLFTSKGDWYFNNMSLKNSGFNQFRQTWGERPNEDNWRRKADLNKISALATEGEQQLQAVQGDTLASEMAPADISFDGLLANLPLKEDQVKASNDKIAKAMFNVGKAFQDKLEEYGTAAENYEDLNQRFTDYENKPEALFNLYYCYNKLGRTGSADSVKRALAAVDKEGKWQKMLNKPVEIVKESSEKNPATKKYEEIYRLFIEGDFKKAEQEKQAADSLYGNSYWTPQLLYIEAIYHVSEKNDSAAINRLRSLSDMYASSPLAEKANTMIDVLSRRSEIEAYLTQLEIKRYEEDASPIVNLQESKTVSQPVIKRDSVVAKPIERPVTIKVDTAVKAPVVVKTFAFNASEPQFVLMLFDKVAPVFVNEARNAFNRFNKEKYYNQKIDITSVKLDDRYHLMLVGPFPDAVGAMDYVDKTKPFTQGRIMPWLTADKYQYAIISQSNLDLLKDNKDVEGYKAVLQKAIPGKF